MPPDSMFFNVLLARYWNLKTSRVSWNLSEIVPVALTDGDQLEPGEAISGEPNPAFSTKTKGSQSL
jgi:hypothetical protein